MWDDADGSTKQFEEWSTGFCLALSFQRQTVPLYFIFLFRVWNSSI